MQDLEETRKESTKEKQKNVFIVQGRNAVIADYVKEYIETLQLEVVTWDVAKAATGKKLPTILETVESGIRLSSYIVVVLTGDDITKLGMRLWNKPSEETSFLPQARPNVLFEAGMALAKLPDDTIFLQFGEIRSWSDVAGLNIIEVKKGNVKTSIKKLGKQLTGSTPRTPPDFPDESFFGFDYGDEFEVETDISLKSPEPPISRNIEMLKLLPKKNDGKPHRTLEIPHETYIKGINQIYRQIKDGGPAENYNLIIGVRHNGLAMAALLAGMLGKGEGIPVFFAYHGSDRRPIPTSLPWLKNKAPDILITDGELKSGESLKNLINYLKATYPNAVIHTAVLCVSCIENKIGNMKDIHNPEYRTKKFIETQKKRYPGVKWRNRLNKTPLPTWAAFVYSGTIKLTINGLPIN